MISSVLIVDDDQISLEAARLVVATKTKCRVEGTRHPTYGIQVAKEKSFDIVLVDISINYRGNPFGGLDIYRTLSGRYGKNGLLAYSQYVDDHILERYGLPINFLEKGVDPTWDNRLIQRMRDMRRRQKCFVAMPFSDTYDPLYDSIKRSIENAGYECIRLDEEIFTTSIVDKIFAEIQDCRFFIFVATGRNPNVFYEAGFALALGKEVITLVDDLQELPFDVKARNTIIYNNDFALLEEKLNSVLVRLTEG